MRKHPFWIRDGVFEKILKPWLQLFDAIKIVDEDVVDEDSYLGNISDEESISTNFQILEL